VPHINAGFVIVQIVASPCTYTIGQNTEIVRKSNRVKKTPSIKNKDFYGKKKKYVTK
jgi:hypothetical protein